MDPSPKSLLRVLGSLKATKKASVAGPAPKKYAITMSRAYPRMRLRRVADPTTPAALAILSCSFALMERISEKIALHCSKAFSHHSRKEPLTSIE
jgi:hypothetical protein